MPFLITNVLCKFGHTHQHVMVHKFWVGCGQIGLNSCPALQISNGLMRMGLGQQWALLSIWQTGHSNLLTRGSEAPIGNGGRGGGKLQEDKFSEILRTCAIVGLFNFHKSQLHIKWQHYLHYPASTVLNGRGHDPFVPLRHVCRTKARFIREQLIVAQFTWHTNCSGVNTFPAKNTVHRTAHCPTDEMTAAVSFVPCEQRAAHSVCAHDTSEKVIAG